MSRRRRWVLGLVIGIPVGLIVVAGVALLVLRWTTPEPTPLDAISPKEIPADWGPLIDSSDAPDITSTFDAPDNSLQTSSAVSSVTLAFATDGSLVLLGGEKPFGEETYRIALDENGLTLTAIGRFYFKVLVATVNVTYEQTLQTDADLHPAAYSASFHAPFGQGESIDAQFVGNEAVVVTGDETTNMLLPEERLFVLGTFSSYALVPLVYSMWQTESRITAHVLVFGGPPTQDDSSGGEDSRMIVERLSAGTLEIDGQFVTVDRYLVSSSLGDGVVLAKGLDFLGFISGSGDTSLRVYRSDYFPDGLFVVE